MKANRIIIALVMLMAGMSSCQDWFDVSPKADVKAEDMFEAESGFRDILTGVYGLMIHENLYGRQLTFGYMFWLSIIIRLPLRNTSILKQ